MTIAKLLEVIRKDENCRLIIKKTNFHQSEQLPEDLKYFYERYDSLELFLDKPYGIRIVSFDEFIPLNIKLYPMGDVIWEELRDDISNHWCLIAESEQLSQYISLDLDKNKSGYCYDSFLETHATPDESPIIAKSFTELLERLYASRGTDWYWLSSSFKTYGDAYDNV